MCIEEVDKLLILGRPPYQEVGDAWTDLPRQWMRRARKSVGLPASKDVGVLAKMVSSLRDQVEEQTGRDIKAASVAIPHLPALYHEDLLDAFEYAGLEYLKIPVRYDMLYETNAAYAGYGFGLCSDYHAIKACDEVQADMPQDTVMAILYTRTALTVSLSVLKSAYYLYEPPNRYVSDFDLGFDVRSSDKSNEEYWNRVASKLEQIMVKSPYYALPSKVLLMGDCVNNEVFQDVLTRVLEKRFSEMPEVLGEDPVGSAAKGAAELAKRIAYDPRKSEL